MNFEGDEANAAVEGSLHFECPRCASTVEARYYGPCESCSRDLRANFQAESSAVEAAEYEPKMNVTPNAIATKD